MREPGLFLLRLTHAFGLRRLRETVMEPAVADMQHEYAEERSRGARVWTLVRGYWSLFAGSSLYAATLPSRHILENWTSRDSAGWRLLRQAFRPAVIVTVLCYAYVGTMNATSTHEEWRLPSGALPLLLVSIIAMVTPPALALGVGWALARDRTCFRAAGAVGLLGAFFLFAYYDVVVTRAREAYSSTADRRTGPRQGSDLSFRELSASKNLDEAGHDVSASGKCSCAKEGPSVLLSLEWHRRLSFPALAWSFVWLASRLARGKRRALVVLGIWPTYVAAVWTMRAAGPHALSGDIPVALAAWGAHLVPLTLGAILYGFRDRFEEPTPRSAPA